MHKIREMYYEISPSQILYDKEEGLINKQMTFEQYVKSIISVYGFGYVLEDMLNRYKSRKRIKMPFNEFIMFWQNVERDFYDTRKKWNYFVNKNVKFDVSELESGKIVKTRDVGGYRNFMIESVNPNLGRAIGYFSGQDANYSRFKSQISISCILNDDETPMKIKYYIKRKRKTYYGADSK